MYEVFAELLGDIFTRMGQHSKRRSRAVAERCTKVERQTSLVIERPRKN